MSSKAHTQKKNVKRSLQCIVLFFVLLFYEAPALKGENKKGDELTRPGRRERRGWKIKRSREKGMKEKDGSPPQTICRLSLKSGAKVFGKGER